MDWRDFLLFSAHIPVITEQLSTFFLLFGVFVKPNVRYMLMKYIGGESI